MTALVQVMAWCLTVHKPLTEPMMTQYYNTIIRPQWVKYAPQDIPGWDLQGRFNNIAQDPKWAF